MKKATKFLAVLLALAMALGISASGAENDRVKRVSCSMYEDGATGRGFSWYTLENGNSDLQIVKPPISTAASAARKPIPAR